MPSKVATSAVPTVSEWLETAQEQGVSHTLACNDPDKVTLRVPATPEKYEWIVAFPGARDAVAAELKRLIDLAATDPIVAALIHGTTGKQTPAAVYNLKMAGASIFGGVNARTAPTTRATTGKTPATPVSKLDLLKAIFVEKQLNLNKTTERIMQYDQELAAMRNALPELQAAVIAAQAEYEHEQVAEEEKQREVKLQKLLAAEEMAKQSRAIIDQLRAELNLTAPATIEEPTQELVAA